MTTNPQAAQLKQSILLSATLIEPSSLRVAKWLREYAEATERIATLEREKEGALAELEKWVTRAENFSLECQKTEQQRDTAVRDAERFVYFCSHCPPGTFADHEVYDLSSWREAIDAARSGERGEEVNG